MRISDWSSDVCSSDLAPQHDAEVDLPLGFGGGGHGGCGQGGARIIAEGGSSRAHSAQYDTPPQPVRPASTAGGRSLAREPMVRKRAASPPPFPGGGASSQRTNPLNNGRASGGEREVPYGEIR